MMRMSVKERYLHDATFHAIVDVLRNMLENTETTATEVREAAMLACEMYEYTHV